LGEEVRYDGGHKRDDLLIATLGSVVEWVPVCPEVEAGMGTPREAIDLVASSDGVASGAIRVRLLGVRSRTDWTHTMVTFSAARLRELLDQGLDGYVLKADSPSCGLEGVRVHREGEVSRDGRGLFAEALVARSRTCQSKRNDVSTILLCARNSSHRSMSISVVDCLASTRRFTRVDEHDTGARPAPGMLAASPPSSRYPVACLNALGAVRWGRRMNVTTRQLVLKANGVILGLFGVISFFMLDVRAVWFDSGPQTAVLRGMPAAGVGFLEAHGLAVILAIWFWRAGRAAYPERAWHSPRPQPMRCSPGATSRFGVSSSLPTF
jgi:uncharacterized protein YbbK (DUF523 family)